MEAVVKPLLLWYVRRRRRFRLIVDSAEAGVATYPPSDSEPRSGGYRGAPSPSHAVQHRVHPPATTRYPPNEVSRVAVATGVRRRHIS